MMKEIIFYISSVFIILGAGGVLFSTKSIRALPFLGSIIIGLSGIYLSLESDLISLIYILVGSLMIVITYFLAVMFEKREIKILELKKKVFPVFVIFLFSFFIVFWIFKLTQFNVLMSDDQTSATKQIGKMFFDNYVVSFELFSVLIISCLIGVVVITKPKGEKND